MSPKKKNKAIEREKNERFCSQCGNSLTPIDMKMGHVQCPQCKKKWIVEEINAEIQWTYHYERPKDEEEEEDDEVEASTSAAGPSVNRKCAKCGNETMTYATRQTRSADEGMTVFFTCTKCGHKDIEYT